MSMNLNSINTSIENSINTINSINSSLNSGYDVTPVSNNNSYNQDYSNNKVKANDSSASSFSAVLSKSLPKKDDTKDKSNDDDIKDTMSKLKQIKQNLDNNKESLKDQVAKVFSDEKPENVDQVINSVEKVIEEISGDSNSDSITGAANPAKEKTDIKDDDKKASVDDTDKLIAILTMLLMGNNTQTNNETTGNQVDASQDNLNVNTANGKLQNANLIDLAVKNLLNLKEQSAEQSLGEKSESKNILKEIMALLNKVDGKEELSLGDKLKNSIQNMLAHSSDNNSDTVNSSKSDIKQIILELVDLKNNNKESEANLNKGKEAKNPNTTSLLSVVNKFKASENSTLTDSSAKNLNSSSNDGDKVLKSIIGDKESNVQSKFSMMMDQLKNTTQAVEAPKEQPVIGRNTMVSDIVKSIKYMEKLDVKELTLKTNPGTLGEITIKLTLDTSNMKATITANTKEAYSILNDNLKDLKKSLETSNIKIPEVSIEIRNDNYNNPNRNQNSQMSNFGFGSEQKGNRQKNTNDNSTKIEDDDINIAENSRQAIIDNNLNHLV
ncbi:flagellar hook-length control protein FliK [Clostridium sp. C8-1-8]|uniref:flagellar hook-length control protein FliK n=1 Tax=Clostridium sp. C8-1-8 TaxID=2698831 RepID=UPI001FACC2E8|nr:flagellar hook-length control protein FliK [Clostridium sp. C8-1-8]